MKYPTVIGLVLMVGSLVLNYPVLAYSTGQTEQTQPALELDTNSSLNVINQVSAPATGILNGLFKAFGSSGLTFDLNQPSTSGTPGSYGFNFFSLNNISGSDLGSALKAVVILFINIFLIVINIVVQILKGILGALTT